MRGDLQGLEANTPGYALSYAFNRKWKQVGQACEQEGIIFKPLPVETLGGWGVGAVKELGRIGAALASRIGREELEVKRHLFQRLGVLLMKGNAQLLLNRIPNFPAAEIDRVL